ncbi:MAG: nucleotidyltransferase family protein [Planctomycetes bacterium]|nr:nucleotidyltransferase family protein [Planctomycetota bacterium]
MQLEEALRRLRDHREELQRLGVRSLAIFGSVARGEADASSDVDILVEFLEPVGLFRFLDVKDCLEAILGRRVDLAERAALKPALRERILSEAVDAA